MHKKKRKRKYVNVQLDKISEEQNLKCVTQHNTGRNFP